MDKNAEAIVAKAFRRCKRSTHSPGVVVSPEPITNLTDTRRVRAVFNFQVSWKIVGNFSFTVQVKNSYDSDPPGTDSDKNNVTATSSVGYTF